MAVAHSDDEVLDAIRNHRPVIRRDALDASWDKALEDWGDSSRLEALGGGALVRSGPIPYASAFATTERVLTLRRPWRGPPTSRNGFDAAEKKKDVDAPSYVFEQIRWDGASTDHPLFDVIKARVGDSPVSDMIIHDAQFFVGSKYSGAPAHYHSHAMNFLVRGKSGGCSGRRRRLYIQGCRPVSLARPEGCKSLPVRAAGERVFVCPRGLGPRRVELGGPHGRRGAGVSCGGELAWSFESGRRTS